MEIKDEVLGIIGMGNIGKKVAQRAKSFGLNITLKDTTKIYIIVYTITWLISLLRFIYE